MAQQRQDRRGEVQAATASATGLACFIFRFLRRPLSTLVRIASGKTEPKFSDIIKIAMVTGVDLNELAHGDIVNIKEDAMIKNDGQNDEVVKAHNFIVWNISSLDKKDILAISRMVYALSTLKKKS
ncbi:helix-turn-helix transcriptional regulator [Escherichia coli]|uniref:helix-turn-helix transcriptional regulator n=1 Tax=Escherichia coli TaxID=562 RepID=UPI0007E8F5BE|nr:helix-turn-helix transcriptional regulator [Escherichia coli]